MKWNDLNKEVTLGIVRHALTVVGAVVGTRYGVDEDTQGVIIGGAISLLGVIWSVVDKHRKAMGE